MDNPELRDELLDYFVDKIYIDDDGKLSFVLKLYDKDEVELQEVSEDEIFDFVGVEVFDNFGLCSTNNQDRLHGGPELFMRTWSVRIPTEDNVKHWRGTPADDCRWQESHQREPHAKRAISSVGSRDD